MKTELEWQQKWGTSFLLAAILLTVLSLPLPAFSSTVTLTGSWATGTTHAKESGTNRALIFIAHATLSNDANLVSVTYGSQQMTKVIERNYTNATTRSYTAAFILNEAGVAAATSSTFTPTWRTTPSSPKYSSAFFSNALQAALVGDSSSGGATTTTITTSALATGGGDMVILGATAGSQSSYTLNNDFTEGTDQSQFLTLTGVTGHKSATGAAETPSATISSASTYQSIIGFVLRANYDQIPPNNAINVDLKTNLGWIIDPCATSYDVYFGTNSSVRNNPKTTVDTNSFDPPSDLEIGTKYYWAVDSNRNGTIITGSTWNFTTLILSDRVTGNMMLLNDNGGWCWYQDEKIVYDPVGRNVLISTAACPYGFGGVGGARLDDVDTTTLNIDTGKRTRTLAKDNFGGDDHNMGAFWIRPDGRYLLVFCSHYNTPELTRLRLSTYPNDGSEWGTEWSYDWQAIDGLTDSQDLSYTNVQYLSSEGTGMGRLYNIVRVNTRTPCISYSDDWGATWKYMGRLNSPAGGATYSNFYHKFQGNGVDRIYFVGNENHPRNNNNGCYAGYIQKGKSYNSYGVEIDSNLFDMNAPTVQAFTTIFTPAADQNDPNAYHTGWVNELELDRDGHPVCLYQTRHGTAKYGSGNATGFDQQNSGAADHRFFYARFNGTSWKSTELAKMGTGLHLPEQDYIGMGCINPDDVNEIYISTQFDPRNDVNLGGYREIFKGNTTDDGNTWNWTQITFNSTINNTRPAIPKWDVNNTAVVWTRGTWIQTNYEQYDLVAVGMVKEQGKSLGLTTYIDANQSNTTDANGSSYTPTGPSGSPGAVDNQWHLYTAYGNGGSCYTAGDSGTENAPKLKTTITGLADGTYDVFAYFWCDPAQDWGVQGGFTDSNMLCFNRQSSQYAEASQFSNSVTTIGGTALLYRVYIGRKVVSGGNSVNVYIDDYDGSFSTNIPTRTTYDGVGVAKVTTVCSMSGDISNPCDNRVDFQDVAELGRGWQTTYDMNTLKAIVDNWLEGTNP